MLYVTFHGYPPGSKGGVNNIYGYDETQSPPQPYVNILENVDPDKTAELRGMLLANGLLYVASGSKDASFVYSFSPDAKNPGFFQNQTLFVSSSIPGVAHPFDFTFQQLDTTQQWYISNQNTNVVVVVTSTAPYTSCQAGSLAPYLRALWDALAQEKHPPLPADEFVSTTFVASADNDAPLPQVVVVDPDWGGLSASISGGQVQNSVRDVLLYNGVLYVADEVGNAVRMYDPVNGTPWGNTSVPSPVHIIGYDRNIYVSSNNSVLYGAAPSAPSTSPPLPTKFKQSDQPVPPYPKPPQGYKDAVQLTLTDFGLGLPSELPDPSGQTKSVGVSGMAFGGTANFYVALREQQQIYIATPDTQKPGSYKPATSYITGLPDQPEFLLWTQTPSP